MFDTDCISTKERRNEARHIFDGGQVADDRGGWWIVRNIVDIPNTIIAESCHAPPVLEDHNICSL